MSLRNILKGCSFCRFVYNTLRGNEVSLFKTLFFNFSAFSFLDAIKMPVWVYQGVILEEIGQIDVEGEKKYGMIRIGESMFFRGSKTVFINRGKIRFSGNCRILRGTNLHVLGRKSQVIFGENVMIGENVKILCAQKIVVGDYSRVTFGCTIIDSDFHYVLDINNGCVKRRADSIYIGSFNWIGNSSVIKKGTTLPNFSIVANGSMTSKDFSSDGEYSFYAGVPAKKMGEGVRRVYNESNDKMLNDFFSQDEKKKCFNVALNENDLKYDSFCLEYINVLNH